jgi:hypothetical protein
MTCRPPDDASEDVYVCMYVWDVAAYL